MNDLNKSKEQLVAELAEMRQRVAKLESAHNGVGALPPGDPQWHSLVANTPVFVLILDRGHRVRYVNHMEPGDTSEEVIGKTPYDYCLPEYHSQIRECIEYVLTTGQPTSYDAEAARPDNTTAWYQAHLGPIFHNGKVVAVSLIAENITARKRAEEQRDRTHAILNAAIECLPFDFFALGNDGRYMLANAVAKMPCGEIVGKTPEEVCPSERDLAVWLENNRRAFAGERVECEVELAVHGENRHYYNIVTPIRDDDTTYGILGVNVDITERKRADEALRCERDRAQMYLDIAGVILVALDAQQRITLINKKGWEVLGGEQDQLLGSNWFDNFIPERDRQRVEDAFVKLMGGAVEPVEHYENPVVTADGQERLIAWHNRVLRDNEGRIIGTLSSGEDITERKRAEQLLRESEERFRRLFEEAHDGILLANADTKQLGMANRAICTMMGYSKKEFEQLHVHDIHPEADLPYVVDQFEKQARGEVQVAVDIPMKRKDGAVFYADVSSGSVTLEGQRFLIGQFRDVTERRQAQEELNTRVRQLATLNNMSRRVGSRLDLSEAVQQALEGLAEELGTDQHLLFLRREGEEDLVQFHPSTTRFSCEAITARGVGECLFRRAFSSRGPVYSRDISDDTRCTRSECTQAGFRSLAVLPLMSDDEAFGVLVLTSSTIRDFRGESSFLETLTNEMAAGLHNVRLYDELRKNRNELVSAYEQIQRTNAELERRVEQRTAEIRSANQELEAYAFSVSHDLRAPLRGMAGFANLLAEDYADCLDAAGREYCQYIADSAARMDELINDLLAYSRLGRTELLMQAVSLERAIREAIGQLESEIKERQANVVVEGSLPDVMGHHKMLVQISANLIGNAVKFVAPDVRPKVRIWAEPREDVVRLWVEDNGIGIDDECHEQIFRVFERLHGIESYPGTGIGLAIVGRVVSRLGGRYGVESQLGEGSRFWVEFSAAREDDS